MSGLKVDTRFLDLSAYYTALQTDALLAAVVGGSSLTNYYTKTETNALLVAKQATLSGTGIVKSTAGTISYLTDNSTNWDFAYGWGNHASVGYLTTISGITAGGELSGTYPNPTILNSAVIGKVLTGYTSGAGTISASDTILQAIQKLNGNTTALTSSGTTNYIPKFSGSTLINSLWQDDGTKLYTASTTKFQIGTPDVYYTNGISFEITSNVPQIKFRNNGNYTAALRQYGYELESWNYNGAARAGLISSYIKTSTIIDENNYYNATLNGGNMRIGGYSYANTPLVVRGTSYAYPFDIVDFQNSGSVNLVRILYDGRMTVAGGTDNGYGLEVTGTAKISGNLTTNITSSLLKTTSGGVITSAVAGTDYIAGGVGTANYFPIFSGSGVLINSLLNQYNGNLGFGTATPTHDLTVEYSAGGSSADWSDFPSIKVSNTNTSGYSFSAVRLDANNGTVAGGFFIDGLGNSSGIGGSDAGLLFQSRTNHLIAFGTNDTERMRITNDGKVIVNSFTNSGYQFDVNGTSAFRGESTYIATNPTQVFYTTENTYNGNAIKFVVGSTSAVDWSGGYLKIQSHHTNSSTFSDTIVVKGANVGIGNTSPSYSLDVTGTGRFTSTLNVITSGTQSSSLSLFKLNSATYDSAKDIFQVFANGDFTFKTGWGTPVFAYTVASEFFTITDLRANWLYSSNKVYSPIYSGANYNLRTLNFDNSTGVLLKSTTAADKILIIQGAASQSANLTEWQNSSGTALSYINNIGALNIGATTASTSTTTGALVVSGGVGIAGALYVGGNIVNTALMRLKGYTVATLPAGTVGDTAYVTDALTPTFLMAVVGGGAVVTPVFYDGVNWISQ